MSDKPTIYKLEKMFSEIMRKRYYVRYGMRKDDFLLALEEAYELGLGDGKSLSHNMANTKGDKP